MPPDFRQHLKQKPDHFSSRNASDFKWMFNQNFSGPNILLEKADLVEYIRS
jgi:hypothetical protein